jgi:hypothetical protein
MPACGAFDLDEIAVAKVLNASGVERLHWAAHQLDFNEYVP